MSARNKFLFQIFLSSGTKHWKIKYSYVLFTFQISNCEWKEDGQNPQDTTGQEFQISALRLLCLHNIDNKQTSNLDMLSSF